MVSGTVYIRTLSWNLNVKWYGIEKLKYTCRTFLELKRPPSLPKKTKPKKEMKTPKVICPPMTGTTNRNQTVKKKLSPNN